MYDPNCLTYWCDTEGCSAEMVIVPSECRDDVLVTGCPKCGRLQAWDKAGAGMLAPAPENING